MRGKWNKSSSSFLPLLSVADGQREGPQAAAGGRRAHTDTRLALNPAGSREHPYKVLPGLSRALPPLAAADVEKLGISSVLLLRHWLALSA